MLGGQPYGAGFSEKSIILGLKLKITDRMIAKGKVGYLSRSSATAGSFTDYHGPLVYVSLTCAL